MARPSGHREQYQDREGHIPAVCSHGGVEGFPFHKVKVFDDTMFRLDFMPKI